VDMDRNGAEFGTSGDRPPRRRRDERPRRVRVLKWRGIGTSSFQSAFSYR
jgi:hypothetical protein